MCMLPDETQIASDSLQIPYGPLHGKDDWTDSSAHKFIKNPVSL